MNKKIYFKAGNTVEYNRRIIDYLLSIGEKKRLRGVLVGRLWIWKGWYYIDSANYINYTVDINDLVGYTLKDIDNLDKEELINNDDIKECFEIIINRLHGKDLYQK